MTNRFNDNAVFNRSTEQDNLHMINLRMNGVRISNPENEAELRRLQMAWDDVRSRISDEDFAKMQAHENRVLTPAEQAAEAKAVANAMESNRDKPSI